MCSNLRLLAQIDAMCSHLPLPRGGKYSSSTALLVSRAVSSINDGSSWLGKWCLRGKKGDSDHERNEPIKRWLQADTAQQKTTGLQKRVTFNPSVNPQQDGFSWEEMKGGGTDFGPTKYVLITFTLWNNEPFVLARSAGYTGGGVFVYFLFAIQGLTSRDRMDVLKGWWKSGGQSPHLGKTSWDPAFWRGPALFLCHQINQIN